MLQEQVYQQPIQALDANELREYLIDSFSSIQQAAVINQTIEQWRFTVTA